MSKSDLEKIVRYFAGEIVLTISAGRGDRQEADRCLQGHIDHLRAKLMEYDHDEVMSAVSAIDPTSRCLDGQWNGDEAGRTGAGDDEEATIGRHHPR